MPIMIVASIAGVWLFSVQHRFEHALWAPNGSWDFTAASLRSTSHLHLPRILQWFSGNIAFSSCAPREPAQSELPARGMPQCKCPASIGAEAHLARRAAGLAPHIMGQRSGALGVVSLRRRSLSDRRSACNITRIEQFPDRPRRAALRNSVFFDVVYEDGTLTSNRQVPGSELDDIDGDLLAKPFFEAQDQKSPRCPDGPGLRSNR